MSVKVLTRSRSSQELAKKSDRPPGFLTTFHQQYWRVQLLDSLTFNSCGETHIQTWPQISNCRKR